MNLILCLETAGNVGTQEAQYPFIEAHSLNGMGIPSMVYGMSLNEEVLGSLLERQKGGHSSVSLCTNLEAGIGWPSTPLTGDMQKQVGVVLTQAPNALKVEVFRATREGGRSVDKASTRAE